jgi:hypothetical protein
MFSLLYVPLTGLLWYLGGYGYGDDGIPDEGLPAIGKAYRRYAAPLLTTLVLGVNSVSLREVVLASVAQVLVNSLGYGESKSWLQRVTVGALLGLPALILYFDLRYLLVTVLTFIPLYKLSLKYSWMTWPVVEAVTGAAQASCILHAMMR